MVKVPARLLTVIALAGLIFGAASLLRIGSSPAQDAVPPSPGLPGEAPPGAAGSTGDSSPGFVGGSPGGTAGSPGGSPGVSGGSSGSGGNALPNNPGSGNPDDVVSSVVNPTEPAYEWTLERMLLATPMPMTQEERTFLFKHRPLEKIREWTQEEFNAYVAEPLGLRQAAQEGVRWRDLTEMLKRQVKAASKFMTGGTHEVPVHGSPSSPAKDGQKDPFATSDTALFEAAIKQDQKAAFSKLRQWRQEIKVLAGNLETMRKTAEKQGKSEAFEKAISDEG